MVNVFSSRETTEELVLVESDYQGSGTEISSESETESVELFNLNTTQAIEYKVGSGSWARLEPNTSNSEAVDLSTTSVFVRLAQYSDSGYVRVRKSSISESLDIEDGVLSLNGEAYIVEGGVQVISGTTYTLLSTDHNQRKRTTSASAVTITVPSGLPDGFECAVVQGGAGQVTFSASGTTINNYSGHTKTAGQYAVVALIGGASNVYELTGNTGA